MAKYRNCEKHGEWDTFGNFRCPKCKEESDKWENYILAGIIVLIFAAVIGLRLLYAKLVFHDMRCAWAECRILKP